MRLLYKVSVQKIRDGFEASMLEAKAWPRPDLVEAKAKATIFCPRGLSSRSRTVLEDPIPAKNWDYIIS